MTPHVTPHGEETENKGINANKIKQCSEEDFWCWFCTAVAGTTLLWWWWWYWWWWYWWQGRSVLGVLFGGEFGHDALQLPLGLTLGEVPHLVVLGGHLHQPGGDTGSQRGSQ